MRRDRAFVVFVTTLVCLWSPFRADRSVLCLLRSSCVLPCPFDPGPEVVIHWLMPPESSSTVHTFYHGTDQLGHQQARYKGRTALFKDQISKGNASLRLTRVQLEDRGRYKCYTSTTKGNNEDFVNVDVQAPVSDVFLEEDGLTLKCESRDIYPKPFLSWSPASDHTPSVTSSESGLFTVTSSVPLTQLPLEEHTCTVSTEHSWRSATYRRNEGVMWSEPHTLSCAETGASIKTLVWTFNRIQTILRINGAETVYDPNWESRLEKVPGSGLVLNHLSPDQQGLYSCLLTTEQSTYLTVTEVSVEEKITSGASPGAIAGPVIGGLVAVVAVVVVLRLWQPGCFKKCTKEENLDRTNHEEENMGLNDTRNKQ